MAIMKFPLQVEKLVRSFQRLQGVGRKSAERFVFDIISHWEKETAVQFASDLVTLSESLQLCPSCNISFVQTADKAACDFCSSERRSRHIMAIVASLKDLFQLESTGQFDGTYFVLGSILSPLDRRGLDEELLEKLLARICEEQVAEVILALDNSPEGEATALYIHHWLKSKGKDPGFDLTHVNVTMLATGVPVGSSFEYIDRSTLGRALSHRIALK